MDTLNDIYFNVRNYLEGTYTLRIINNFFDLFLTVLPYLAISIIINIAAVRYFRKSNINFFSKSQVVSIFIGALIGLVSPLPTYAAIPIGISMLSAGVPFSAIIAFILSSPLMNPSVFFLTATQIGFEMAVARTLAAFLIAIAGGLITMKILKFISVQKIVSKQYESKDRPITTEIYRNSLYVAKTFSISILLSAAVKSLVPQQLVAGLLGGNTAASTLAAMGMGIPFYTCGGAAIPFMETLYSLGMNKGAVLAFFLAGPATKLETLYAYKTLLGVKVLIFYLVLTLVFSFSAGLIYSVL